MEAPLPRALMNGGSAGQGAARLLIVIARLGHPVQGHPAATNAVRWLPSLTMLEKFDFWVRNPDYLADELLSEFESGTRTLDQIADHVVRMLNEDAPDFHKYPMTRYLYGAYEVVDNPLSILKSYGHILHRRVDPSNPKSRRDYFLLPSGITAANALRSAVPSVAWYDLQCDAIALLSGITSGAEAKRRQYEQPEYEAATHGALIPSIGERVRSRALRLGIDPGVTA